MNEIKDRTYLFTELFKVRDYECDLQGVVNNANYQHYMEHARHEFLTLLGENFSDLHNNGLDIFVRKVNIEYLRTLRSGNKFICAIDCYIEGAKIIFLQDIFDLKGQPIAQGAIEVVAVENGRLSRGEYFRKLLQKAEQNLSRKSLGEWI